jgi:hypothetical protein
LRKRREAFLTQHYSTYSIYSVPARLQNQHARREPREDQNTVSRDIFGGFSVEHEVLQERIRIALQESLFLNGGE